MKIEKVESLLLGNNHIVRIHTDNGISGVGQSACWGYPEATERIVHAFSDHLIGQDPSASNTTGSTSTAWPHFGDRPYRAR